MVDKYTKESFYDYPNNANLVVNKDTSLRRTYEPSGEPEPLTGKKLKRFGDRAERDVPEHKKAQGQKPKEDKNKPKQKPKNEQIFNPKKQTKIQGNEASVLDIEVSEQLIYRPKTKETQLVYEELLTMIHKHLPDQSQTTLKGALDVILAILKTDDMKDSQKILDIQAILGYMSNEEFNLLYQLSKNLVDYEEEIEDHEKVYENEIEVPVEFENEENEDEESGEEVEDDQENIEEDEELKNKKVGISQDKNRPQFVEDDRYKKNDNEFNLEEIANNGYWIQNYLREKLKFDETQILNVEKEILGLLNLKDKREAENKLVLLLKAENFPFIKFLLENRYTIYFLTRLGKSQSEEERSDILNEMSNSSQGQDVLLFIQSLENKTKKGLNLKNLKMKNNLNEHQTKMTDSIFQKVNRNVLDLESLKFSSGSHLMANKKVQLPKGSFKEQKKGYEEVYIPPPTSEKKAEKEIAVTDLPEWMLPAFQARDKENKIYFITNKFNRVQSKVLNTALYSDENMLICAPTSSGKTNIALLTILRVLSKFRDDLDNFKIVYIAPMKALVKETVGNFTQRLKDFNLVVKELSGDVNLTKKELETTHVIVATPEKWDIITRKTGEKTFTELVKLIIIDEIHLLHDTRGAVLESIVARTIRKTEVVNEKLRIVALSATLPNYEDVATFLRVKPEGLFYFDGSYRPVPLEQRYIGITEKKSIKKMLLMNEITYDKVTERAGKKQIIIFVHSRRETLRTAKAIKDTALSRDEIGKFLSEQIANEFRIILNEDKANIRDNELRELLEYGIGIHHAGMNRQEREIVEDYFNNGYLQVIVSTATLAWGVNLPAHTVIIKGTQIYDPEQGKWTELSPLDVLQMMGRAGRFGYGSPTGEGIIITSHYELQYYLSLLNQQLPIESQLIGFLPDALNAEIVLGTITNVKDAVNWLAYSYIYIRMLKNPQLYNIDANEIEMDNYLIQRRTDLIHTAASTLDKNGLIKYDRKSGLFQMTQLGKVASYFYIKFHSMAIYNENLKPNLGVIDLFRLFSLSSEFKQIPIREEEKKEIDKFMVKVPIPIKGSIEEPASKINILLQAYISQFKIEGYAISSDMVYVAQSAGRIMRALFEISLKRGWATLCVTILNVCKMIEKRMWSTMTPLRQFKVIPEDILYKIERKEQLTWDRFYDLTPTQICELIKVQKTKGEGIHRLVHTFPRLELTANIQPLTRSTILVELIITADFQWNPNFHGTSETFYIIVEDNDSEIILHSETFILKQKYANDDQRVTFIVPMIEPMPPQYFIRVTSDRWINCEKLIAVSFKHTILPEKFPPHTPLVDLQPMLFNSLKWSEAEHLYQKLPHMNAIQTQTFKSIYETNESIFIGAPTGSGKTLCAEFAILKYLKEWKSGKNILAPVVFVSSIEAIIKEKMHEFNKKFNSSKLLTGDVKIDTLTGQLALDNKIFDNSHIILTTPDKLDMLTRRWRKKQNVQEISLVIVDEIHLLGESGGVLEVVLSRLRYMSNQLDKNIRFIVLSVSLANPYNLTEWLGINNKFVYNFNPNVRPNKLEIFIQGFDHAQRKIRLMAMSKPLYSSIKTHGFINTNGNSKKMPCMIYTSDRKQARITALDLLTNAASDDDVYKFLLIDSNSDQYKDYEELIFSEIDEPTLKHTLRFGVGYIHDGLSEKEKQLVIQLFKKNTIQVLILTHAVCWEINLYCHLVVVLDPQKYDGREHAWVDYSIPDMLQIMGRASLQTSEKHSNVHKFILYCQTSKKEFFKKFLYESFPLESHLNHFLHDHLNAEIVADTIQTKQDCLDWLTWTFLYRRLLQNPNYYDLKGKSNVFLNDYLSELIENTLMDLKQANCISLDENNNTITPLNFGRISVFYYIKYNTIDLFSQSLKEESRKMRDLLDILRNSYEFADIPIRKGEEHLLQDLAKDLIYKIDPTIEVLNEPHTKAYILLQCYFSRKPIPSDLLNDQKQIIDLSQRLILAMVDVLSTKGLLKHALLAMELSQMIIQAMWISQCPLFQLPYFTFDIVKKCSDNDIKDISDLMNMEDEDRKKLLHFSDRQFNEIAKVCNRYPSVDMNVSIANNNFNSGENIEVSITLNRDWDSNSLPHVPSLYFSKEKEEAWWLIVGEPMKNILLSIKRFTFVKDFKLTFKIPAPEFEGNHAFHVYLLCDSWIGCDQEEKVEFSIKN